MSGNENVEGQEGDMSTKIFDKFIDDVENRITKVDQKLSILALLRKKYKNANVKYTSSKDFRSMMFEHLSDIRKRRGSIYQHIHEVSRMLSAAKLKNGNEVDSDLNNGNEASIENMGETSSATDEVKTKSQRKKEKKRKRRIKKLELHLKDLSKEIKRLGEKELTLDDMDNDESDYVMEGKLKLRFNRVWEKLCKLKDVSTSTGRVTEQYLIFEATRFQEINVKLEKLMNKPEFPNFSDVLMVVRKVNTKKELHLSEREVDDIAEKSFKIIGNRLQHRREVDLAYNFGSHLTEDFKVTNDPSKIDQELNQKLRENRKLGKEKLGTVINNFSKKQEENAEGSSEDSPPMKRKKVENKNDEESENGDEEDEDNEIEEENDEIEENDLQDVIDELKQSDDSENDDNVEISTGEDDDDDDDLDVARSVASSLDTEDDQFLPEDITIFEYQSETEHEPEIVGDCHQIAHCSKDDAKSIEMECVSLDLEDDHQNEIVTKHEPGTVEHNSKTTNSSNSIVAEEKSIDIESAKQGSKQSTTSTGKYKVIISTV
ncbi:death domain-associated protein 6-like isoform X2 [Antedon mediterranea]|uniref:death domain-associated protein 6-like isoform X2 n=1 Tax=Antedon mediterranea TaxID=105859 RepID=UPI003AF9A6CC